jgi:hypothetical protein
MLVKQKCDKLGKRSWGKRKCVDRQVKDRSKGKEEKAEKVELKQKCPEKAGKETQLFQPTRTNR